MSTAPECVSVMIQNRIMYRPSSQVGPELSHNEEAVFKSVGSLRSCPFHPARTVSSPASATQNPVLFFHQREIERERLTSPLMGAVGQVYLYSSVSQSRRLYNLCSIRHLPTLEVWSGISCVAPVTTPNSDVTGPLGTPAHHCSKVRS